MFLNSCCFRETSSLQLADIISIDYIVDGQLVTELEDGETVSLNFSLKNKTEKSQVNFHSSLIEMIIIRRVFTT